MVPGVAEARFPTAVIRAKDTVASAGGVARTSAAGRASATRCALPGTERPILRQEMALPFLTEFLNGRRQCCPGIATDRPHPVLVPTRSDGTATIAPSGIQPWMPACDHPAGERVRVARPCVESAIVSAGMLISTTPARKGAGALDLKMARAGDTLPVRVAVVVAAV